ncbi:MAG TPA: fatty acid desaturase [Conexibacter sp.]|nr:fatty acid desaturase [Conexibacter sp.]
MRAKAPERLPEALFVKRPLGFALRFWFAIAAIAASYALLIASLGVVASVLAVVLLGLMYAHLVELQHECVHEHGFHSRRLNRLYGQACGFFMFSSYTHYKCAHLRHHVSLGEPGNHEFFDYPYEQLESPLRFLRAAFHLGRYAVVARNVCLSVLRRPLPDVPDAYLRRTQNEYRSFLLTLVVAVAGSVAAGSALLLVSWVLPLIAISEPVHFVIELPEHFGLDTQGDPNVARNTRTVRASRAARWFTNGNNLHTAHHYNAGVPMGNVPQLDELVQGEFQEVEASYWSFFRRVRRGEIVYQGAQGRER